MEDLQKAHALRKIQIQERLRDFSKVSSDDFFYELCFCVMTPQSNAFKCDEIVSILKEKDFLYKDFKISPILKRRTRFYKHKSEYLKTLKKQFGSIREHITGMPSVELREFLVKNVKGIGYKEASHFLRNVGHRDLAILDRHILRNLVKHKVIEAIPESLNRQKYMDIEQKFIQFSRKIEIPLDELDLLFWSQETGKIFK